MNLLELFRPIRCFVFDVDGVMTDGTLQLLENGEQLRRMHIKDGYALQLAVRQGYRVLVISGGLSVAVQKRLEALGVTAVFTGVTDKKGTLIQYVSQHHLQWEQVLFMGDDIPDHAAMQLVGLPVCPADAAPEIRSISRYISPYGGGQGCVREVIEKVLKLNGHWELDSGIAAH